MPVRDKVLWCRWRQFSQLYRIYADDSALWQPDAQVWGFAKTAQTQWPVRPTSVACWNSADLLLRGRNHNAPQARENKATASWEVWLASGWLLQLCWLHSQRIRQSWQPSKVSKSSEILCHWPRNHRYDQKTGFWCWLESHFLGIRRSYGVPDQYFQQQQSCAKNDRAKYVASETTKSKPWKDIAVEKHFG